MATIDYVANKRVLVRAATDLLPGFVEVLPLLKSRIRGAWLDDEREGYCVAELIVESAPAEAEEMSPVFAVREDGSVVLTAVEWFRKSGTWLATSDSI